jgi:hypothetical protein
MKSMACLLGALVFIASEGVLVAQPAAAEDFSLRVVGLRVVSEPYTRDMGAGLFGAMAEGTSLAILLESKGKQIVHVNMGRSALRLFQDDKGTDLNPAPRRSQEDDRTDSDASFRNRLRDAMLPRGLASHAITGGQKAVLFEILGRGLPSKGSTSVKAVGSLRLFLASEAESEIQRDVPLKEGTAITAGPIPLTIVAVEQGRGITSASNQEAASDLLIGSMGKFYGTVGMTITLRASEDLSRIAAIHFYDQYGNKVNSGVIITCTKNPEGKPVVEQKIGVAGRLDWATLEVEFWTGLEEKDVPFSVSAGLSFDYEARASRKSEQATPTSGPGEVEAMPGSAGKGVPGEPGIAKGRSELATVGGQRE